MEDPNTLWLESVYSDGTAAFVSSSCPKLFETVTIRLRFYRNAPVKHVFLRTIPNGVEQLIPMTRCKEEKGLSKKVNLVFLSELSDMRKRVIAQIR